MATALTPNTTTQPIQQPGSELTSNTKTLIEQPKANSLLYSFAMIQNPGWIAYYKKSETGLANGNTYVWTTKARIKAAQLPTEGKIRYVPPTGYKPSNPLPKNYEQNGIRDKFGNVWTKGPSRTSGEAFEWDVQLSALGRKKLGWASRDNKHINISLKGKITHE